MKHSAINYICSLIIIIPLFFSCREQLISSADENKEALIQGSWILQSTDPPRPGQIFFTFNVDFTIHIAVIDVEGTHEYDAYYRIEDGDLYILFKEGNEVLSEFVYNINELTPFILVLAFTDNSGQPTSQTYVRP
ncbi:hypothetical protein F9K33_13060 [bacterium]|nr:MAG: hypothetical protein F9K33_13060 [bacterium]